MVTVMLRSGTPVSLACISISVTPQDETAPRKASLFVKASGCGREDESSGSATPRTSFFARPMVPLLDEAIISIFSSAMARIIGPPAAVVKAPRARDGRGRMRGKGDPREARRRHAHPRPQDDPRVRPEGGSARLRLSVVGGDAARSLPAAGGGRHRHQSHQAGDVDRGG